MIELAKQWNEFYVEERVITMDEVLRMQKRGRVSIFKHIFLRMPFQGLLLFLLALAVHMLLLFPTVQVNVKTLLHFY